MGAVSGRRVLVVLRVPRRPRRTEQNRSGSTGIIVCLREAIQSCRRTLGTIFSPIRSSGNTFKLVKLSPGTTKSCSARRIGVGRTRASSSSSGRGDARSEGQIHHLRSQYVLVVVLVAAGRASNESYHVCCWGA